jgi:hypothetical protein
MLMQTNEGRQFAAAMQWAVEVTELRIQGKTRCGCGCGRPDRVEFTVADRTVAVITPDVLDLLITSLQEVRVKLWGEP